MAKACDWADADGVVCGKATQYAFDARCSEHKRKRRGNARGGGCGYVRGDGSTCKTLVVTAGERCRAHTTEGLEATAQLAIEREADLIARKTTTVRELDQQLRALQSEVGRTKHDVDMNERNLKVFAAERTKLREEIATLKQRVAEVTAEAEAPKRCAALLARAEAILLSGQTTDALRAEAESCRETAKEIRLQAVFTRSGGGGGSGGGRASAKPEDVPERHFPGRTIWVRNDLRF